MSLLNFSTLTLGDLCTEALFEAGIVGQGMTPGKSDITRAWSRAQFVLQQWERRRWMIYALQAEVIASTGAQSYTVGMNGEFDLQINDFNDDAGSDFGTSQPVNRPSRLEGVFFRQQQGASGAPISGLPTNQSVTPNFAPTGFQSGSFDTANSELVPASAGPAYIDYPLQMIEAGEDYWTRVRLKALLAWPQFAYYEASWPLGKLWLYPAVPAGYQLGIVMRALLPSQNATLNSQLALPPEYHRALLLSTAMALRSAYQMQSFPGDMLPKLEAEALRVLRKTNTRVPRAQLGREWQGRGGRYNIFSDQTS